ncbi:MAG TPA: pyridoxal-dependent decarboxylase [Pseudonocardiaceae bacterium]|nr:pyridoxal-dependent decarboxylase [Pseudonocardiaceae bacterium]
MGDYLETGDYLEPATAPPATLAGSPAGLAELSTLLTHIVSGALAGHRGAGPLPQGTPAEVLAAARAALGPTELPEHGTGAAVALRWLVTVLGRYGLDLSHCHAAAHLQPPPLTVAVAADALASVGNASLDTYDSGPATLAVEGWVVEVLAQMAGLGSDAHGVLTPGGSMSNLLALLLARDGAATRCGVNIRRDGVAALPRPVVLASEVAHFSVQRACATLGLGEAAVRAVEVDHRYRMRPDALVAQLDALGPDVTPVAVVATAGTTDFGSVDPLPEIAEVAAQYRVWVHVDAAYGFGALFSDRMAPLLSGLEAADSVTLDLHKIGWQPAAASALLVRDTACFASLERQVAYLNPVDDSVAGYDGLLGRSLQTTRRADAVKIAATLLAYGRTGLGRMVDICHDLARHAQRRIDAEPALELVSAAELTTVVFRYRGVQPGGDSSLNAALRRRLLRSGQVLIGRTSVRLDGPAALPSVCLKLTLLNPTARPEDIDSLLEAVIAAGRDEELS